MSCSFEEDLSAYVDGELPEVRARAVKNHLAGCGECRTMEQLIRKTVMSLDVLPAFEPSAELRRRVMSHLEPPPSPLSRLAKWLRPQLLVPIAGVAAVGAIVFAVHLPDSMPQPSELSQVELAQDFDAVADLDVLGLESVEDVDVLQHLDELQAEVKP